MDTMYLAFKLADAEKQFNYAVIRLAVLTLMQEQEPRLSAALAIEVQLERIASYRSRLLRLRGRRP